MMPAGLSVEAYEAFLGRTRDELLARVGDACARAGRDASEVTLVAVSKTVGSDEVASAFKVGYHTFGENRPQELKRKVAAAAANPDLAGIRFDMIGNLQKNKINQVLGNATLIHSVSSVVLAQAIASRAHARGVVARCLMEVNVLGEASKSGVAPSDAPAVAEAMLGMEGINLEGLMTMAPAGDPSAARAAFCGLRELKEALIVRTGRQLPVLSCGMSDDFEIAVEEGSTMVRLGRVVFDPAYAKKVE